MHLVPILSVNHGKTAKIVQYWMFLERNGTYCIEIDSVEGAKAFAEENGFPLLREPVKVDDLVFLFIDPNSEGLESFYTWSEVQPAQPLREVWRPFLWVSPVNGEDMWGTNQYLSEIQITPKKTVFDVIGAVSAVA